MDANEIPAGTGSGSVAGFFSSCFTIIAYCLALSFIWDKDGHIVTNFHVIRNAQKAKITIAGTVGRSIPLQYSQIVFLS